MLPMRHVGQTPVGPLVEKSQQRPFWQSKPCTSTNWRAHTIGTCTRARPSDSLPPQMSHQMGRSHDAPQPVMYNQPVLRPAIPLDPSRGHRCTSCRDDDVTMAVKLKERRLEERDGEKESKKNKSRTKSSAGGRKDQDREEKGRGEEEGERTRGRIKDEMLMSVSMSPDPLISSPLSMRLLISLSLNL
ncbi:phosphatidylinositol-binding clathrin assembly protein-like isoform X1 [Lates japonicus]|uniref:Phosphatidylinositol-binding clathrin assembly protein-like isoform X1 n=1 Tax=Lates japonicus TaxID=270547 RepID=A0AAD3NKW4_LATJO|nr:phosphatidylinositol-binding clathrin assembly protein-like isoform X1 [Lates japonicus]